MKIRTEPCKNKQDNLPAGISGPISRLRKGAKYREHYFTVLLPRFNEKNQKTSVYIGTDTTLRDYEEFKLLWSAALAKATLRRNVAFNKYKEDERKQSLIN